MCLGVYEADLLVCFWVNWCVFGMILRKMLIFGHERVCKSCSCQKYSVGNELNYVIY